MSILIALSVSPSTAAETSPSHALVIVSPAAITKSLSGNRKSVKVSVVVRNDGATVTGMNFSFVGDGEMTITPSTGSIASNQAGEFPLTLTPKKPNEKYIGVLLASAAGATPGTVALELNPSKSAAWWLYLVIFGPMVGAAIFMTLRALTFRVANCGLTNRLGPANWDFSKSWGSNLTVVGALLGTILAAGALPDTTSLSKQTYAGLNLLFGVLILVAPLVYTATQTPVSVNRTKTLKEPQYQGYVVSFLIASAITLWATLGELATVTLLFNEIRTARSLPAASVGLLIAVVGVSAALLCFYAWRSLKWIIERQCKLSDLKDEKVEELTARFGPEAVERADINPELPAVPLL